MSYIINADIELRLGTARLIQLSDDSGSGAINTAVVDESRLGAEGEVDSYLARRYAVPISVTTYPQAAGVLKSASLDLAEYRLHARRREVPVGVTKKRDAALAWLARVSRGDTSLPSVSPITANAATGIGGAAIGEPRVFTRDELSGF